MPVVEVDLAQVSDWDRFHDVFVRALGFPDFYGRT
jgi:RNAse (barnase) inhibitor barstar